MKKFSSDGSGIDYSEVMSLPRKNFKEEGLKFYMFAKDYERKLNSSLFENSRIKLAREGLNSVEKYFEIVPKGSGVAEGSEEIMSKLEEKFYGVLEERLSWE